MVIEDEQEGCVDATRVPLNHSKRRETDEIFAWR